jgi:hypothetical protein
MFFGFNQDLGDVIHNSKFNIYGSGWNKESQIEDLDNNFEKLVISLKTKDYSDRPELQKIKLKFLQHEKTLTL